MEDLEKIKAQINRARTKIQRLNEIRLSDKNSQDAISRVECLHEVVGILDLLILRPKGKRVIQLDIDDNEIAEFESIKEAGKSIGINPNNISLALSKRLKTAGGFKWKLKKI